MNWLELTVFEKDELMRHYLKQGEDAYLDGKRLIDNPFGVHEQFGQWWRRGYQNAAFGSANSNG